MKNLLFYMVIVVMTVCCSKDSQDDDYNGDQTLNLEGSWYVSGSTIGFCSNDSVTFRYRDNVLGYQEYTFKKSDQENDAFLVSGMIITLQQREGEADNDYEERLSSGQYSKNELIESYFRYPYWIISGKDIYGFTADLDDSRKLIAKIVKWSKNQLIVASASPGLYDIFYSGEYNYYTTLNRIK